MKIIASNKTKASIVLFTIQSNGENNVLLYLLFRSRDVTRLQIDPIALVIRSISDDCMFVHVTEFQSPANPSNA
jgi:hypothetical protein